MSAEQRERHTVIDNRAIGQNGTDGIANLLIAVSTGNPSQTKQNVKISFINCDFLKSHRIQIAI